MSIDFRTYTLADEYFLTPQNTKKPPCGGLLILTNPSKKLFYASAAIFTSLIFALIFASISLANSGLSLNNPFTESLP